MSNAYANLRNAVVIHQSLLECRNAAYINLIQQINTKASAVIKDDLGSQFIKNCGRDIAGEIVRNYFDTSNYNITVDQLAMRILKFSYEDEYDPLSKNGGVGEIRKSVYNYNELQSKELDAISADLAAHQEQLFPEARNSKDTTAQKAYRESQRDENGNLHDELTGAEETHRTYQKNGKDVTATNLQADHIQSREAATYNSKYLTEDGKMALRNFYNSSDNMQIIHASANASKGDVRVYDKDGNDITYKATPEQLTQATIDKWEKDTPSGQKRQELINQGYLVEEENGNVHVPKSVRKELENNIRHSQNEESKVILQNTKYGEVAKEAAKHTKAAIGKIIAGQIIYYAAPPLVYEVRLILKSRKIKLDNALEQLTNSAKQIGDYVFSHIKDMFSNVLVGSLKKFIKSFMDILIGLVKATVKKLLKMAKNLVLSAVDAVRIIADKNTSSAEKADSVFNLFGVTITSCVVELIFELVADSLHIPEPFDDIIFGPLQILATVVCTNLTMLILQKADLFDVRFGFKINAIKKVFADEYAEFEQQMELAEGYAESEVDILLEKAKQDTRDLYDELTELNPTQGSVRSNLDKMSHMFNAYIDFDSEWEKFLGIESKIPKENEFRTDYSDNATAGISAVVLYNYFVKRDKELEGKYSFVLPPSAIAESNKIIYSNPFLFSTVRKCLDNISDNTLIDFSRMVDALMEAGSGVTATKLSAKQMFDAYLKDRSLA